MIYNDFGSLSVIAHIFGHGILLEKCYIQEKFIIKSCRSNPL